MTGESSARERFQALSNEKAKLLELLLRERQQFGDATPRSQGDRTNPVRVPASAAQRRLWFIDRLQGASTAYHVPLCIRLRGRLNRLALQAAMMDLIARHEALRTFFVDIAGEPSQEIAPQVRFELPCTDLMTVIDQEAEILRREREDLAPPFDLNRAPLFRARLLQLADEEHVLLMIMHHMITDGWSMGVLLRELSKLYDARRRDTVASLPSLQVQYADYARRQTEWLEGPQLQAQLSYWKNHLRGAPQLLELPTDRPRPATQSYSGANVNVIIDAQLIAELHDLARRMSLTPAMVFYTAWAILVSRLSGQEDVVIGMPVANRQRPEIEGVVGLFVNTVAVRVSLADDPPVQDLLRRAREAMLEAYAHQQTPFEKVVEALQPVRSLSHTPLFQVMFVMHGVLHEAAQSPELAFIEQELRPTVAHFDLTLSLRPRGEQTVGCINYASELFDAGTIESWADSLLVVLHAIVRHADLRVSALPLMSEREQHRVVEMFNAARAQTRKGRLIHEVFEQQVARTPNAVAIVYEEDSLTYRDLNAQANQLAWYLRRSGVGKDKLVALCVERSLELVIGILGVLKAGGAYVPLDPVHPRERLAQMLEDCRPAAVLTQRHLAQSLQALHSAPQLTLDARSWTQSAWGVAPIENLEPDGGRGDCSRLAYVIYTSGSTGAPKGVMLEHRNVLHFLDGLEERIHGLQPDCRRVAWNSSFGFDMSVKAWGQLIRGRTVFLIPEAVRLSGDALVEYLDEHQIDAIECTPSHLRVMQEAGLLRGRARALRKVLLGGEAIDATTWRTLAAAEDVAFFNMYGPTECSVDASCGRIEGPAPNVGQVMPNARIYILDQQRRAVPVRVAGEVYIGGKGVARGYWNRSELTQERFVADPFSGQPGARMYRTGDLARWRADGTIEYVGRNDQQVKIRGFRIELGEIESQLVRDEGVREVAVIAREDAGGDRRLVAYVVPADPSRAPGAARLREHLKHHLPEYMVPGAFVTLDRLPLNANGKLDRHALPPPDPSTLAKREHESPRGQVEQAIAESWQELLRMPSVGRHDNFFELGGHSLLAVKALFMIGQALGCTLTVTDLYRNPTVEELAAKIEGRGAEQQFVSLGREAILDPAIKAIPGRALCPPRAALLTGATGFVGRFLLTELLTKTDATVYCLVRASTRDDAAARLKTCLSKWDLWRDRFERRIVAVAGDLRVARAGVDTPVYESLCREVDAIYHCATSMNHLETYAMAKPTNVDAIRELLRLATTTKPKLLNYVSTLSVFSSHGAAPGRVVDEASPIDMEQHQSSAGYAASKWVGEKILMTAAERGIPCNVFRLGLVWADSRHGRYDELQREYRVFKSCLLSDVGIGGYDYPISPISVDDVARAIVFLAQRHDSGHRAFHIAAADHGLDDVFRRCNEIVGTQLELLPLYDWICRMKQLHQRGRSLPIVPLIEYAFTMDQAAFYARLQRVRSERVPIDCSQTRRELEQAGITYARFDELLVRFVADVISRDDELRNASIKFTSAFRSPYAGGHEQHHVVSET